MEIYIWINRQMDAYLYEHSELPLLSDFQVKFVTGFKLSEIFTEAKLILICF